MKNFDARYSLRCEGDSKIAFMLILPQNRQNYLTLSLFLFTWPSYPKDLVSMTMFFRLIWPYYFNLIIKAVATISEKRNCDRDSLLHMHIIKDKNKKAEYVKTCLQAAHQIKHQCNSTFQMKIKSQKHLTRNHPNQKRQNMLQTLSKVLLNIWVN